MKKYFLIILTFTMLLALCSAVLADENSQSETLIPFRFASKEEGTELMLANEAYYAKFSPNKLG